MRLAAVAISFIALFIYQGACGKGKVLNSKIEIDSFNGKLSSYLELIEKKSAVFFSYNPSKIPADSIINQTNFKGTLKNCLQQILPSPFYFLSSGQYITIKRNTVAKAQAQLPITNKPKTKKYIITGRVINSATGQVVKEAIVYDNNQLISTTTNHDGFYQLQVSAKNDFIPLTITSTEFFDTLIIVEPYNAMADTIALKPIYRATSLNTQSINKIDAYDTNKVENVGIVNLMVPQVIFDQTNTSAVYIEKPAQISFLPTLGTNRKLSGLVENKVSLNVLAGYSGAVNGLEIGGLLNIVRTDVRGFQMAGFGNVTGGMVNGVQVAGFFNNNRGSIQGAQIAGFYNLVLDTVSGYQIAGFANVLHGKMDGYQVAGFSNYTSQNVDGLQIAGFTNVARGNVKLMQLAGFNNIGGHVGGGQVSGFTNLANGNVGGGQLSGFLNIAKGSVGGWQIAGFSNIATDSVNGGQISGFINTAKNVNGLQISTLNFADSSGGLPIGIFSFIKKGYHSIGFGANETFITSIFFKTGVDKFYNIFSLSYAENEIGIMGFGYGFGTLKRYNSKWLRAWEYEAIQLKNTDVGYFHFNMLSQLRLKFGYSLTNWFQITGGIHYAHHIRDKLANNQPYLLNPYQTTLYTLGDTEWTHWLGANLSLSFSF